ncbi:MAG: phage tail family protein [Candidatus Hydrogenedentes bacterium]|nr:phage tail family protein [Candidatus Hydrogenedentota bacterium]
MVATLGSFTFDPAHTSVQERHNEVGGRRERTIEISGVIVGASTVDAIEARLDALLDAASAEDYSAALSLRPGRRLWVRRESFTRQVESSARVGSFTLMLKAKSPFEEAVELSVYPWNVTDSGDVLHLASAGNVFAMPSIRLAPLGNLINPAVSDGTRTIEYAGTVRDGSVLIFDGANGRVTLDENDVSPYTAGEFPRLEPEGATLTFSDDVTSAHAAFGSVEFRSRWW